MAFGDVVEVAPCIRTMELSIEVSATSKSKSKFYDAEMSETYVRLTVLSENKGFTFLVTSCRQFTGSYTLKTPNGTCLSSGSLAQGTGFPFLAKDIPLDKFEVINGGFKVVVRLSNQEYVPAHSKYAALDSAASFLERLYHDVHDRDVSFIVNNPDLEAANEITVERAHKLVLNQWPYFKRMFSSDFMEGGAGKKEIQVKDVKPQVFHFCFDSSQPTVTFSDPITNPQEASWEDVFLAAHRYELDELCHLVEKSILEKLTPEAAIPFLFRTGYQFDALRVPSIKYIASTSASQVASKSFRDAYQDHPEFGGLLFELFEACYGNK
ncbi:hypothetical protein BGZ74_009336 [Mortierella antarctica]|nr:hypothetical protein BGZ74_009336 [Mortierella antarctica]